MPGQEMGREGREDQRDTRYPKSLSQSSSPLDFNDVFCWSVWSVAVSSLGSLLVAVWDALGYRLRFHFFQVAERPFG